ncbi:MAG TPA: hypothetical protein VM695_05120 [Phycisphaerae bacterium]|nr:hypothetical protein [Phycisphaerae bacterium]
MSPNQADIAAELFEALGSAGWIVPLCERDVAAAEARLGDAPGELPGPLADPSAVLSGARSGGDAAGVIVFPPDADIDATLARAAREGGAIAPEIEQAMRRDRDAAEREADRGCQDP